jgi:hypothetical protein
MKKKLFLSAVLLLAVFIFSKAQIIPDYIVTNQNDTIYGKVKLSDKSMHSILFRREEEKGFKEMTSEEIKSIMDDGRLYYESHSIRGAQKVFLKCLVKGDRSLFRVKNHFYLLTPDTLVKIEKKDTVFANLKKKDNKYLGLLKALMPGCQTVDKELKPGLYGPKDLSRVVGKYNNCFSSTSKSTTYFRTAIQSLKVGGRVSTVVSTMRYYIPESDYHTSTFKNAVGFNVGLFVMVPLTKRLSIQPEFNITQKGADGNQTIKYGSSTATTKLITRSYDVSFTMLQLPIIFNYAIPTRRFTFLISAGGVFGNAIALKGNVIQNQYTPPDFTDIYYRKTYAMDIDKGEMGYRTGFSVLIPLKAKRIGVNYFFEKTFMNYTFLEDKIYSQSHALSLSYIF